MPLIHTGFLSDWVSVCEVWGYKNPAMCRVLFQDHSIPRPWVWLFPALNVSEHEDDLMGNLIHNI